MSKEDDRAQAIAKRAAIRNAKQQDKEKAAAVKEAARVKRALKIMSIPVHPMKTAVYWILKDYTHRTDSFMSEPIRLTKGSGY